MSQWSLVRARVLNIENRSSQHVIGRTQNVLKGIQANEGHVKNVTATFEGMPSVAAPITSGERVVQPLVRGMADVAPAAEEPSADALRLPIISDESQQRVEVITSHDHKNMFAVDSDDDDFVEALEAEKNSLEKRTPAREQTPAAAVATPEAKAWALYAEGQNMHFGFGAPGGVPNLAKAEECFREAATLGHADAAYDLGLLLLHKNGNAARKENHLVWWQLAAKQGHQQAQEGIDNYVKDALRHGMANQAKQSFSVFDSFMAVCLAAAPTGGQ